MRWIDRGPEPDGVAGYAQQFTQGRVDYFQNDRVGGWPTASAGREFRRLLGSRSNNICWYCERQCEGEGEGDLAPMVDHFRPRSRFPELTYAWSNLVFSCRRCYISKGDKWPETGYVDPCAEDPSERPERYFDYFAATGEILTREGLSEADKRKALYTIDDLSLNARGLVLSRHAHMRGFIAGLLKLPAADREAFIAVVVEEYRGEYAGVIGMVVEQLRRVGRI